MISEQKFKEVATKLGVEVAALKAVAEVESGGTGFLPSGEPIILFEPHVWWRQLKKFGIEPTLILKEEPSLKSILYPKWGTYKYGKISEQHSKLAKAVAIHRDSALESASWGAFQVVGANWPNLGYTGIQQFINDAYRGADGHFDMFIRFVIANNLVQYLRAKNWTMFALKYNGSGYAKNKYHIKLANSYNKYK